MIVPKAAHRNEETSFYGIIGKTGSMQALYKKILRVAHEDVTVFIIGESGTGKELVAHAIHRLSKRSGGPFVPVNMGALAGEIAFSEIFGHEKGSFTGATEAREGIFGASEDGTLFLDEVGSMDHKTQTALLRILENRVFNKVGGRKTYTTNARIVAANTCNLRSAVKEKTFRRDLLYRLEVFSIELTPLRERREDIPLLIDFFINRFNEKQGTGKVDGVAQEALECLMHYSWPGNVRELMNVIRSAMLLAKKNKITPNDLPPRICAQKTTDVGLVLCFGRSLKEVEKLYITRALQLTSGNKSEAARKLGVSRRYLYNKIEQYNIA